MNDFKHTLIFGASGDVGHAFVQVLASQSQRISLISRSEKKIQGLMDQYPNTYPVIGDVMTDPLDIGDKIRMIDQKADLVINALGAYVKSTELDDFDPFLIAMDSNFKCLVHILNIIKCHAFADATFINVSSIASFAGKSDEAAYSIAKSSVDQLLSRLYLNEGFSRLRVLNLRPGAIKSAMTADRENQNGMINPIELAKLGLTVASSGKSLRVPVLDVFKA